MSLLNEIFLIIICLTVIIFFDKFKNVVVYYAKYSCYIFIISSCSLFCIPFFLFRPRNVDNLRLASFYCRTSSKFLGLNWIMRNTEYLTEDKAYIVVSNHQSSLDILGMFMLWPIMRKCTAIARNELFYLWPFGCSAWLAGLFYIPRQNTKKSREIMIETARKIGEKNIKLWIFPEGKRFADGKVHSFKRGAFEVAIKTKIPILPVVFSSYYNVDHDKKRFDSGTVIVTVLPPISTEGKSIEDMDDVLKETHEKISTNFHEINEECKILNGISAYVS